MIIYSNILPLILLDNDNITAKNQREKAYEYQTSVRLHSREIKKMILLMDFEYLKTQLSLTNSRRKRVPTGTRSNLKRIGSISLPNKNVLKVEPSKLRISSYGAGPRIDLLEDKTRQL